MNKAIRGVAWLNAVFQVAVGLICIASPATAAGLFKVAISGIAMQALLRMFGGLLASAGVISAIVAMKPDGDSRLRLFYAGTLLLNVAADVVVIGAGELAFSQLAVGMGLELVLAVLLLAYKPATPAAR